MVSFATVFLIVRVYLRVTKAKLWWDDYILLAGWVCANIIIFRSLIWARINLNPDLPDYFHVSHHCPYEDEVWTYSFLYPTDAHHLDNK